MHAMLGYLQLYAHKDNHPLALKSPDSTQFLSGFILDFKGTKKVDILHYSLAIDNDLHKKNRNTLKKITNNSLSKGEMFYRNISWGSAARHNMTASEEIRGEN